MSAVRRAMAQPAEPVKGVSIGNLDFYTGGLGIPAGNYVLFFENQLFAGTRADGTSAGEARLGVMVSAYPFEDLEHPKTQFLSYGSNAHKSFMVDPDSQGMKILPIPGAPGAAGNLNNQTNWYFFLKSMYDQGMPPEYLDDDLSVIQGIWATISQVDEPAGRKDFRAKTGESAFGGDEKRNNKIPIIAEVLPDGSPWEGGGGMPEAPAPTPTPKPAPALARPGPKPPAPPAKPAAPARAAAPKAPARPGAPKPNGAAPARRPAPAAPAAEVAAEGTDDDVMAAAVSATAVVLTANPQGCSKLNLRTGTFKELKKTAGPEMAQAVMDQYFQDEEALNSVVGQHGFVVNGLNIEVSQ